jgi:hypothetical protein
MESMDELLSQISDERYGDVFEAITKIWISQIRKNYMWCLCEWAKRTVPGSDFERLYSDVIISLRITISTADQLISSVNSLQNKSAPHICRCRNMVKLEVTELYKLKTWIEQDYIVMKNGSAWSQDDQVANDRVKETTIIATPIGGVMVEAVPYESVRQEEPRSDPPIDGCAHRMMSFTRRLFGFHP